MQHLQRLKNPFEMPGKWYKANLHTHTTASDGRMSLEDRIKQYRGAGYNVLAITDHGTTSDCEKLSDKKMLVVSGMEYHPKWHKSPSGFPYHFVALDVPHGFSLTKRELLSPRTCIAKVRKAGGVTILAHPYWLGQTYHDFKDFEQIDAIEVFNSIADLFGRGCSENEWVSAMDNGMFRPCVGVDDTHYKNEPDSLGCWTWLKMPSLTVKNVLNAIRSGACYASQGPRIHDFHIADGKARLKCTPARRIHMNTGFWGWMRKADDGKRISSFNYELPQDWKYVRAKVVDENGMTAWTNPIMRKQ